jgi:hypothetical protein
VIWVTLLMSYKRPELLTVCKRMCASPDFGGDRVAHLFLVFCVMFDLFVYVMCLVFSMLPVFLGYPVMIALSVFCNVFCYPATTIFAIE